MPAFNGTVNQIENNTLKVNEINDTNPEGAYPSVEAIKPSLMKVLTNGYNIDELKLNGKFAVLNATGALPSGYSADNNIFIECYMWFEHYGRQVLHDVRSNKTFSRNLFNDVWQSWEFIDYIVEQGTSDIWTYEKWASGKAVCWGSAEYSGVFPLNGNNVEFNIAFPFTFTETPFMNVTNNSVSGWYHWVTDINYTQSTFERAVFCSNNDGITSTGTLNIFIVGKWK